MKIGDARAHHAFVILVPHGAKGASQQRNSALVGGYHFARDRPRAAAPVAHREIEPRPERRFVDPSPHHPCEQVESVRRCVGRELLERRAVPGPPFLQKALLEVVEAREVEIEAAAGDAQPLAKRSILTAEVGFASRTSSAAAIHFSRVSGRRGGSGRPANAPAHSDLCAVGPRIRLVQGSNSLPVSI